jgi:hypothetical protein
MGREANCMCECNGAQERVKALLEPPELILRGAIRRKIPFSAMKRVSVANGGLRVDCGEKLWLDLGEAMAAKWAQAMLAPPPTLAKKLGIVPGSAVRTIGKMDDDVLTEALGEGRTMTRGDADLIVARVNTQAELAGAFKKTADALKSGTPIWIVYRKGPGHAIGEADVRKTGLAAGVVDVKVASVSAQLTALKFVKRIAKR